MINNSNNKIISLINSKYIYLIFGIFLAFIFDSTETSLFYYLGLIISTFLLLSIFFLPPKKLLVPVFILLFLAKDTTQSSEEFDFKGIILSSTPWQHEILGITPATIIGIWLIIILIRLNKFNLKFTVTFFYFFFFMILLSIYWGYPQDNIGRFITDLKTPIYFFVTASIFNSYFKNFPDQLYKSTKIALLLITARITLDGIYLITNFGDKLNTSNYLSFDSTKAIILILIFYLIAKTIIQKSYFINSILISLLFSVLLAYQTKWLILMFFLGLLILLILVNIKTKIMLSMMIALFIIIILPFLILSFPKIFELLNLRFSAITSLNTGNEINDIDLIRTSSIINSVNELIAKKSFLTGLGYGSWFTDNYFPMLNLNSSSFEDSSISSGRFYRIHDYFFFFLFKFGLIGLFLFTKNFFTPIFKLVSLRKKLNLNNDSKIFILVIASTSFSILTSVFWTGKGLILIALITIFSKFWYKSINDNIFKKTF